jgi:hypothetical protein
MQDRYNLMVRQRAIRHLNSVLKAPSSVPYNFTLFRIQNWIPRCQFFLAWSSFCVRIPILKLDLKGTQD